ncbi:M23 family metallopeptidase [Kribbella sp. CA-293567]|uniref:M23 family metallopeptidase n=1 Tax=Kribbella sp. CA-293567 TaxID=3002436 RepID=UPI0022DD1F53|nr:M23 family metallopeptidase [Kribbella sp. CA-293567]WBQ06316.1 M23 family metallopeptidase [Kribbella sp. CA-293567]
MSPHHDVSEAGRTAPRRTPAGARRVAKHRLTSRRTSVRGVQWVGLTAALAAAAGTSAVALSPSAGPANAGTSTTSTAQLEALTAARIERRELASRDLSRLGLTLESTRKAQVDAAAIAKARAAKLAANATLTQRRALALATAKAVVARKAAAAAAAKAKARAAEAAKAKAEEARAEAAPRVVLPTTGYRITATFGQGGGRWANDHTGLDFAAPIGTPIRAVLAGEVIQADYQGAYGRQVKVRHSDGTVTSYSHMSAFSVSIGDSVSAGEQVGAIGVTGNTTGPHLHFEVLLGGDNQINPKPWLSEHGVNP